MNEPITGSSFLTKSEVAQMFSVTTRTIELWSRKGLLPYFKIGRTVRYDRAAILVQIQRYSSANQS